MQTSIKSFLLNNFSHDDFDLNKTTVGVTTLSKRLHFKLMLYSHFCDLEDFVNCCIVLIYLLLAAEFFTSIKENFLLMEAL